MQLKLPNEYRVDIYGNARDGIYIELAFPNGITEAHRELTETEQSDLRDKLKLPDEELTLSAMREQVKVMNALAIKQVKGSFYHIPLSVLEGEDSELVVTCRVRAVDLQENSIELIYDVKSDKDCWTTLTIETFEKHAKVIA
jgi:hypothetical protein